MIQLKNCCFSYKKKAPAVLQDVSLTIEETGMDAFLGHNGAGKTTLFLLICGHLKPGSGEILFRAGTVRSRSEIAFVPESGGFFESLTPHENLRFRYLLSEAPESKMSERIQTMLRVFGLSEHGEKQGKALSSGLKKRLALACALVGRPRLLLLDEPTNGVDPETVELLAEILRRLRDKGTKILLNTHDLDFAAETADRILVFDAGRIVAERSRADGMDKEALKRLYLKATNSVEALRDADI